MNGTIGGRAFGEVRVVSKDEKLVQLVGFNVNREGRVSNTAWQEEGGNAYFETIRYNRSGMPIKTIDRVKDVKDDFNIFAGLRIFYQRGNGTIIVGTYAPKEYPINASSVLTAVEENNLENELDENNRSREIPRLKELGFPINTGFFVAMTNDKSPPNFGLYNDRPFVSLPPDFDKTGKSQEYRVQSVDGRVATIVPATPSKGFPKSLEVLTEIPYWNAVNSRGR